MEDIPCSSKDADQVTQHVNTVKRTQPGNQLYGGKNCCVPQCTNNSLRNPELSFYKIPKDSTLKKKWEKPLQTKGLLNIGLHYRVCSVHFSGGKKTYTNNVPTIFAPKITQTPRKRPNRQQSVLQVTTSDIEVTTSNMEVNTVPGTVMCDKELTEDPVEDADAAKLEALQSKYNSLEKKYEDDVKAAGKCLFRMERFIGSDSDFRFYTGFPDYATFKVFFNYLSPACNSLIYYGSITGVISSANQKKHGKQRSTSPEQELFMILARMRCGFLLQDLAHRYGMSFQHCSRIWITWITFLDKQLRSLPIWPTRKFIDDHMPACFKQSFPQTRVIIDCTELLIEMPSSCRSQSATFSTYKNHNTAKGLLGISPNGYPSFVSRLYAGRASDKKITKDCGILGLLEAGDQIMADRGFDIESELPAGVSLNIPPFLNGKDQLSLEEETSTRKIASVRVHVERAISRIKNYRILHQVLPITMAQDVDKIWTVCSYLTLFLPPLINEK